MTMNKITFAKPINIASISSLALSLVLISLTFSVKRESVKVGLFTAGITLGVVAASNKFYGSYLEQVADRKNSEALKLIQEESDRLQQENGQLKEGDEFLSQLNSSLQNQVKNLEDEIQSVTSTNESLSRNLTKVTTQYQSKINELKTSQENELSQLKSYYQNLLADSDGSFNSLRLSIINLIIDALEVKIDSEYENMFDKANKVIDKGLFDDATRKKLEEYKQQIDDSEQYHLGLVEELKVLKNRKVNTKEDFLTHVNEAIATEREIMSEIATRQIQYRAILKDDDTRKIRGFKQNLPKLCKKEDAMKLLAEQGQSSDAELVKIQEWQKALETTVQELKEEHERLLAEHEKILQENKNLKRPLFWSPAPREDLRMANNIMAYFEKHRIILDRGHSEYNSWEATVSFYPARDTVAPLVSDLNKHSEILQHRILRSYNEPKFNFDPESGLYTCHLLLKRKPEKPVQTPVEKANTFIQPQNALIDFVQSNPHIGLWGQTNSGKTTAISNILGGMQQLLGESTLRVIIPKIDVDTEQIFPPEMIDYVGIRKSIFGLLEAALEIQYRIHVNEQKFMRRESLTDFEPVIYFIDEVNMIVDRFGKVNDEDLSAILSTFKSTLSGERLAYFEEVMQLELQNYKNEFFRKLLLFVWQTGRSLRVKTLIAGQNLMPGKLKVTKGDILNCAYLALGKSLRKCAEYRVDTHQESEISEQISEVTKLKGSNKEFKYIGLFCPQDSDSYLAYLPEPNYYKLSQGEQCSVNSNQVSPKKHFGHTQTLTGQERGLQGTLIEKNCPKRVPEGVEGTYVPCSEPAPRARWTEIENLPNDLKNLGYRGGMSLFYELPKKPNGSVHRIKAYRDFFGIKKRDYQKPYSQFIDILEEEFG